MIAHIIAVNRYQRHFSLREIGSDGQKKIMEKHATVIGTGALGGTIAMHLARCGIGAMTLCEYDIVDTHNLPRQVLFTEADIGKSKLRAAMRAIEAMNSSVDIRGVEAYLSEENVADVLDGTDIVLDGTDNMATRRVINSYCVKNSIPYVYGGVLGTYGMTLTIVPPVTPCLSCVFAHTAHEQELASCEQLGVISTIPAIIGAIQATEAIKVLLGADYSKDLIIYDVWTHSFDRVAVKKKKDCATCSGL